MKITRQNVLDALQYEPLQQGTWVDTVFNPNCHVCAVGGTLRRAGLSNDNIRNLGDNLLYLGNVREDYDYAENSIQEALYSKHYLRALSIKFEHAMDDIDFDDDMSLVRNIVSEWAKENLPEEFESEV